MRDGTYRLLLLSKLESGAVVPLRRDATQAVLLGNGEFDRMLEYIAKEDLLVEFGGDVDISVPDVRRDAGFSIANLVAAAARKVRRRGGPLGGASA